MIVDRSSSGPGPATRQRGRGFPPGPGHERRRGARARPGLLRRAPEPQGEDAARHAHPARAGLDLDRHRAGRGRRAAEDDRDLQPGPRRDLGVRRTSGSCRSIGDVDLDTVPPGEEHSWVEGERGIYVRTYAGVDVIGHDAPAADAAEAEAECVRIEAGIPRFGVDMDGDTIPQEAGINDRAVSFTKGCYVGQETVARLFYKGKPNRHLRGLKLSRPAEHGAADRARGARGRPDRLRLRVPHTRADRARPGQAGGRPGGHRRRRGPGGRGRRAPIRLKARPGIADEVGGTEQRAQANPADNPPRGPGLRSDGGRSAARAHGRRAARRGVASRGPAAA